MSQRLNPLFAIIVFATILLSHFGLTHAQQPALPEGWCQQPSDVQIDVNDRYTDEIGHSVGGIRSIWQPYNSRIVLQRTVPREVVQVVAEGVTAPFELLRYTANCHYLITRMIERGQYIIVVYDLFAETPGPLGRMVVDGHSRWNIESSSEGTYLLVTDRTGLRLWNFTTNTQTELTSLVRSDCDYVGVVGCSGVLDTYREARWDVPHALLQLDLISNYTVTVTLPNVALINTERTQMRGYTQTPTSPEQINTAAERFLSEYACLPRVQYQTYNQRIILKSHLSNELLTVVQDNLDLIGFQFLGWSASCTYIAAAIEDESGLRLAAWNVNDMSRQERPSTDWVDRATWAVAGDSINVITDGGTFDWNLNAS